MKKIYILNYQREIPPFAQMEVFYAKRYFDEVVFITRKLINDNSSSIIDSNVSVIQVCFWGRLFAVIGALLQCLSKSVLKQIYQAFRQKVLSLSYIKALLIELYVAEQLYSACKRCVKSKPEHEKYVLSCWFNGIAIAAAQLQRKLQFKSYSFAHAFEVDPKRNPYVGYMMEEYKHKYLTKISFIAETMLKKYTDKVYPIIGIYNNAVVDYLGTLKMYEDEPKSSEVFTICSCSTVNEIKRLPLLVDALSQIKDIPIRWIHIGDGPDMLQIKSKANACIKRNVECCFLGRMSNDSVQEFYSKNAIDLFVNVSRLEGLPISIMEAMSYSIPCMATDVGGTSEIVNNNNGILINSNVTPLELRKHIIQFIQLDDMQRSKMKLSAFNDWFANFNADRNISGFYTKMIANYNEQ